MASVTSHGTFSVRSATSTLPLYAEHDAKYGSNFKLPELVDRQGSDFGGLRE